MVVEPTLVHGDGHIVTVGEVEWTPQRRMRIRWP